MVKRIFYAAAILTAALVAIIAGWQFGLAVLLLAALVFGIGRLAGVEIDATSRWSSALYGDDREDANHWSRTGGKRKR